MEVVCGRTLVGCPSSQRLSPRRIQMNRNTDVYTLRSKEVGSELRTQIQITHSRGTGQFQSLPKIQLSAQVMLFIVQHSSIVKLNVSDTQERAKEM